MQKKSKLIADFLVKLVDYCNGSTWQNLSNTIGKLF